MWPAARVEEGVSCTYQYVAVFDKQKSSRQLPQRLLGRLREGGIANHSATWDVVSDAQQMVQGWYPLSLGPDTGPVVLTLISYIPEALEITIGSCIDMICGPSLRIIWTAKM